ncbi:hypothetical protein SmJEL517_g04563 [Synchytrium microbalum]|uniref:TIR domain-containing protein n=1 Tax=Synchytrium microbalum TaxID=1806994 RepID=A0A507BYQ8_9FUNG|nr:uncharacterized protein SmJEL517_g04563 [Synchytrium microbalum]TPX32258.1 hypothetical protein SmJEL517_g04563 [Synchytrium microbalum]
MLSGWECKRGYSKHHVFISYRARGANRENARNLAEYLNQQTLGGIDGSPSVKIHCYLDQLCLVDGANFVTGFQNGLVSSRVVLLYITSDSLHQLKLADQQPDNMLLEWEQALKRATDGNLSVFPLFVGSKDSKGNFEPFSSFPGILAADYPDTKHRHPSSNTDQTIRQTVKNVFEMQGCFLDPGEWDVVLPYVKSFLLESNTKGMLLRTLRNPPNPPNSKDIQNQRAWCLRLPTSNPSKLYTATSVGIDKHFIAEWDLVSGAIARKFQVPDPTNSINDMALGNDETRLFVGQDYGQFIEIDLNSGRIVKRVDTYTGFVHGVFPVGQPVHHLYTGGEKGGLEWQWSTGKQTKKFVYPGNGREANIFHSAALSMDKMYAGTFEAGEIIEWDIATAKVTRTFKDSWGTIDDIVVLGAPANLLYAGQRSRVVEWDLTTGTRKRIFNVQEPGYSLDRRENVYLAVLGPPDNRLYAVSGDHIIKEWSLDNGLLVRTFVGHSEDILALTVVGSPMYRMYSSSQEGDIREWNISKEI